MATLSAILKADDKISSVFEKIANSGTRMIETWQSAGSKISTAFGKAESSTKAVSKALDKSSSSSDTFVKSINNLNKDVSNAIDNKNDFAEASIKTQTALTDVTDTINSTQTALTDVTDTITDTTTAFDGLADGVNTTIPPLDGLADSTKDAEKAFSKAIQEADKFRETTARLESELQELQNAYIGTALQKGKNSEAAKELQAEIASLSEVINQNKMQLNDLTDSANNTGTNISNMAGMIQTALVSAGLAKLVNQITQSVIKMANEFSNAEAAIIRSTGASGRELQAFQENMFNLFATARNGNLSSVAYALSEVNTRMGLTGDELERVTGLFMDFADMNGVHVKSSITTLSQVMTRWQLDASQTESLLDRLTFAGQATGKSVYTLGYYLLRNQASFDALGFSLNESIALMSAFEAGGINTQAAMYGLRRVINYAARDGKDAGETFREIIYEIKTMDSQAEATARAIEAFGVRAGPEMAVAIQTGNLELEEWVRKIESADGTLAATAEAATTLQERWTIASNTMNVAFSQVLSPAIAQVSGMFAELWGAVGTFLQRQPVLVAAISGIGSALAVLAGAVAIVTFTKKVAIPVIHSFTAAVTKKKLAMGKLTAIITIVGAAIGAVAGIISFFTSRSRNANTAMESLTMVSQEQYNTVRGLTSAYEQAVYDLGKYADETIRLRGELAAARLVFEANKETIGDFTARIDGLSEAHDRMIDNFNENMEVIAEEARNVDALADRLQVLSEQTELTAGVQHEMSLTIDELNAIFPDLGLEIDSITGSLNWCISKYREFIRVQAELDKYLEKDRLYIWALQQQATAFENIARAREEHAIAEAHYNRVRYGIPSELDLDSSYLDPAKFDDLANAAYAIWNNYQNAHRIYEEIQAIIAAGRSRFDDQAQAYISYEDAISAAIQSVSNNIDNLIERYNEAFDAAHRSITGQFNLWDEAAEVIPKSIDAVTQAMETQIAHWQAYNDNLAYLTVRSRDIEGLADLISTFADGSANSVAMIAGMANATDEELANMVNSWKELQAEQEAVSHSIAGLNVDFHNELSEIAGIMRDTVNDMNMEDDAAMAARRTIDAYISALRSGVPIVLSVAQDITRAVNDGLGLGAPLWSNNSVNNPDNPNTSGPRVRASVPMMFSITQALDDGSGSQLWPNHSVNNPTNPNSINTINNLNNMNALNSMPNPNTINTLNNINARVNEQQPSQILAVSTGATFNEAVARANEIINTDNISNTPPIPNIPGFATGTINAPDIFIAGERGPELIVGAGGSTVFTADETSRIIANGINNRISRYYPNSDSNFYFNSNSNPAHQPAQAYKPTTPSQPTNKSEKRIILDITGRGEIEVYGSTDAETIWEYVSPRLKDAFFTMIREDIFEEGVMAYDF